MCSQAEGEDNMLEWVTAIEDSSVAFVVVDERKDSVASASAIAISSSSGRGGSSGGGSGGSGIKKLTSFRNRSPSAHSPATKARKASSGRQH